MKIASLVQAVALVSTCFAARLDPDQCGPKGGNQKCKDNKCCSQYGWCGTTTNYCLPQNGCQSKFGRCTSTTPPPTVPAIPVGKSTTTCGPKNKNTVCASGYCCSQYGFCGKAATYCGSGCQRNFGSCLGAPSPKVTSSSTAKPSSSSTKIVKTSSTSTRTSNPPTSSVPISKDGRCGIPYGGRTCKGSSVGSCCSRNNWCGNTSDHCKAGCQSAFGICSGSSTSSSKKTSSTTSASKVASVASPSSFKTTTESRTSPTTPTGTSATSVAPAPVASLPTIPFNPSLRAVRDPSVVRSNTQNRIPVSIIPLYYSEISPGKSTRIITATLNTGVKGVLLENIDTVTRVVCAGAAITITFADAATANTARDWPIGTLLFTLADGCNTNTERGIYSINGRNAKRYFGKRQADSNSLDFPVTTKSLDEVAQSVEVINGQQVLSSIETPLPMASATSLADDRSLLSTTVLVVPTSVASLATILDSKRPYTITLLSPTLLSPTLLSPTLLSPTLLSRTLLSPTPLSTVQIPSSMDLSVIPSLSPLIDSKTVLTTDVPSEPTSSASYFNDVVPTPVVPTPVAVTPFACTTQSSGFFPPADASCFNIIGHGQDLVEGQYLRGGGGGNPTFDPTQPASAVFYLDNNNNMYESLTGAIMATDRTDGGAWMAFQELAYLKDMPRAVCKRDSSTNSLTCSQGSTSLLTICAAMGDSRRYLPMFGKPYECFQPITLTYEEAKCPSICQNTPEPSPTTPSPGLETPESQLAPSSTTLPGPESTSYLNYNPSIDTQCVSSSSFVPVDAGTTCFTLTGHGPAHIDGRLLALHDGYYSPVFGWEGYTPAVFYQEADQSVRVASVIRTGAMMTISGEWMGFGMSYDQPPPTPAICTLGSEDNSFACTLEQYSTWSVYPQRNTDDDDRSNLPMWTPYDWTVKITMTYNKVACPVRCDSVPVPRSSVSIISKSKQPKPSVSTTVSIYTTEPNPQSPSTAPTTTTTTTSTTTSSPPAYSSISTPANTSSQDFISVAETPTPMQSSDSQPTQSPVEFASTPLGDPVATPPSSKVAASTLQTLASPSPDSAGLSASSSPEPASPLPSSPSASAPSASSTPALDGPTTSGPRASTCAGLNDEINFRNGQLWYVYCGRQGTLPKTEMDPQPQILNSFADCLDFCLKETTCMAVQWQEAAGGPSGCTRYSALGLPNDSSPDTRGQYDIAFIAKPTPHDTNSRGGGT